MDNNQTTSTPPPVAPAPVTPPPPAEPVTPAPQMPPVENKPSSKIPMIIIIVLFLICLVAGGIIAYRMLSNPSQDSMTEDKMDNTQITASPTPFDDVTPTPAATQSAIQSDIMSAIEDKTYNSLVSHMTPSVMFEIESSEGLPAATPEEAVTNLDYLDTAVAPWNFDQNDPVILSVKDANPDEYGPLYVGIASNDMMVAFGFDEMDKINLIKVAATYKLLVN